MSDDRNSPDEQLSAEMSPPTFSTLRVIVILVVLIPIFGGLLAFFGFSDGWHQIQAWMTPAMVPAKGRVIYNGQPLTTGNVVTQPVNRFWKGSIGFLDQEGNFTLKTDIDGHFVDGAYPGQHKVIVEAQLRVSGLGAAAPPSLVPDKYTSFATTPLVIEISSTASENDFEFSLEGVSAASEREERPESSRPRPKESTDVEAK